MGDGRRWEEGEEGSREEMGEGEEGSREEVGGRRIG